MPNGGSDCCGTCWFNARNKGEAGRNRSASPSEPNYCITRVLQAYQLENLTKSAAIAQILNDQQQVEQSDPWIEFAGMFKDDPLFNEFVEDMAAYRRELDSV
jgi:hypothetical protein